MNLRIPQGKGSSPVVTLTHWMRQQWGVARWLGPCREETQVQALNGHRQDRRQCGQGHRCWAAQLSLPQPKNHRPDSCPSQLQILSFYDSHGDNELQTDTVLRNGFAEQFTAHRLGRALSIIPLCFLRSTEFVQLKGRRIGSCRPFCLIFVDIILVVSFYRDYPMVNVKVDRIGYHYKIGPQIISFPPHSCFKFGNRSSLLCPPVDT